MSYSQRFLNEAQQLLPAGVMAAVEPELPVSRDHFDQWAMGQALQARRPIDVAQAVGDRRARQAEASEPLRGR